MSLPTLIQHCLTGVSLGGAYALIAIGYTMVYGILRLINFAHGDVFMVSGILMVYLNASGLPLYISLPLSVLLTVVIGFVIERVAYKPLRSAPRMSIMISAIGVSSLLQNLVLYVTGGLNKVYPTIPWISQSVKVFGATTKMVTLVTPVRATATAFVCMWLVTAFLGMVMSFFNVVVKKMSGIAVVGVLEVLSYFSVYWGAMTIGTWLVFISPVSWTQMGVLDWTDSGLWPTPGYAVTVLLVGILVLGAGCIVKFCRRDLK